MRPHPTPPSDSHRPRPHRPARAPVARWAAAGLLFVVLVVDEPAVHGQTLQGFDGQGTPFAVANVPAPNPAPAPAVTGPESSDGRYLELLSPPEAGFTRSFGTVGFERTDAGACRRLVVDFDFRITCRGSNRLGFNCADGFSFVALDTSVFGTAGAPPALDEAGRAAIPSRSIGIGFIDFSINGPNRVVVTFNNSIRASVNIPFEELDLVTGLDGEKGAFHRVHAEIELAPSPRVTVALTDGTDGGVVNAFDDLDLSGTVIGGVPLGPYESRAGFGARTGDASQWVDLDNVSVIAEGCATTAEPPVVGAETVVAGAGQEPASPAVQVLPDGGSVAVWDQLDGEGTGVYARLYDRGGVERGPAFRVNREVAGDQVRPAVAVTADGGLVFAWQEREGSSVRAPDGRIVRSAVAGTSIVSRAFDPGGAARSDDVEVSGEGAIEPEAPAISSDEQGGVVVSWEDRSRARGRLLGTDAAPRGVPLELDAGFEGASNPRIAAAPDGSFVAVWATGISATARAVGSAVAVGSIVARRFDSSGAALSDPIPVSDQAGADAPAVALAGDGSFVVAWQAPGEDAVDEDVFARRFAPDGSPEGPFVAVSEERSGRQRRPRVDRNGPGDYVIAWESEGGSAGTLGASTAQGTSIVARFFQPEGAPASDDVTVAGTEAGAEPREPDVAFDDRDRAVVTYTRRGPGERSEGVFATEVESTIAPGACFADDESLCLGEAGRFRVRARYRTGAGVAGAARAKPLTADTGYFWFFEESNVELVVKALDACAFADRFWVFAGGLTDVFVDLEVTDTASGESRVYTNPGGTPFQPIQDTAAFATCDRGEGWTLDPERARRAARLAAEEVRGGLARAAATCVPDPVTLCLGGRFAVTVDWDSGSNAGQGAPFALTEDTGYFWFFEESNVELVVKVLDACAFADRFWVFAGGLTDQGAEVRVLDTETGAEVSYRNPRGTPFQPIQDTGAFDTCP